MNFKVKECGMFINQEYPNFLCSCDCCGEGCGKIKCPYCLKELNFQEYLSKQGSCLNTNMTIKEDHQYCYQLQQQLFTTGKKYNDFVVCSIKENIEFVCQSRNHCSRNGLPLITYDIATLQALKSFIALPLTRSTTIVRHRDPITDCNSVAARFARSR